MLKKTNLLTVLYLMFLSFTLSSCEAIAGIFKAGMGVGIFIVISIVAVVVFIVMRVRKK